MNNPNEKDDLALWDMPSAQLTNDQALPFEGEDATSLNASQQKLAIETLQKLLLENEGQVSSLQLNENLRDLGMTETGLATVFLRHYFRDAKADDPVLWTYAGRSFYTPQAYQARVSDAEQEEDLSDAADAETKRKREESRLCRYVLDALKDIYASDAIPNGDDNVFDVHNQRPSTEFRNVDLIAIDWRNQNPACAELVAIEVKLQFSASGVQQASNYRRFAQRVWLTVVIDSGIDDSEAAMHLREMDSLLFDHVIQSGIGLLACTKARGKSYRIFPLHWPTLQVPSPVEIEAFRESYRELFESAGLLVPEKFLRLVKK